MAIALSGLRKKPIPITLNVIKHKFHELHFFLLTGIPSGIRDIVNHVGWRYAAARENGKEIRSENDAEDRQDNGSTHPQVHSTEAAESGASATFISAIFKVVIGAAGRPLHSRTSPL